MLTIDDGAAERPVSHLSPLTSHSTRKMRRRAARTCVCLSNHKSSKTLSSLEVTSKRTRKLILTTRGSQCKEASVSRKDEICVHNYSRSSTVSYECLRYFGFQDCTNLRAYLVGSSTYYVTVPSTRLVHDSFFF